MSAVLDVASIGTEVASIATVGRVVMIVAQAGAAVVSGMTGVRAAMTAAAPPIAIADP